MNKIHRTIWSETRQTYVVAHEKAVAHGKPSSRLLSVVSLVSGALAVLGLSGQSPANAAITGTGCSSAISTAVTSTCTVTGSDSLTVAGTGSIAVNGNYAVVMSGGNALTIEQGGSVSNTTSGISAIFANNATQTGYLDNAGTISSNQSYGIEYLNSTLGGINNRSTGQITSTNASGYALDLNGGTVTGGITNAGVISAPLYGLALRGVTITAGDVINQSSGTISATSNGMGLFIDNGSTIRSVQNSGTISGGNIGAYLGTNYTIANGFTNSGTIRGSGAGFGGLALDGGTLSGGITNTGSIIGPTGVYVSDSAIFNGVVSNRIGGRIVGTSASGYAVSRPSGVEPIISVENQGTSDTRMGILIGAVNGKMNFTNNGSWSNQQGNASGDVVAGTRRASTITGNYVQGASGVMVVGAAGSGGGQYSTFSVGGTANISGRIHVDVATAFDNGANSGATLSNVVTATGGLTTGALQVTDNSVLLAFGVQTTANALSLCVTTQGNTCGSGTSGATFDPYPPAPPPGPATPSTAFLESVLRAGSTSGAGVAGVLDQLLATLVSNGTTGNASMDGALNTLLAQSSTDKQVADAVSQLLPILVGAVPQSGVNALHSMNKIIQARIESNQGLSSGNAPAERYMWLRTFGNWGKQDDHQGISGFKSRTGGVVIGGDAPVTDKIRVGGAFTYARSDVNGNSSVAPNSVDVDTYELVGYGSYNIDPHTDINIQIDAGVNKARSERRITFTNTTASAAFTSTAIHGSVGLGRVIPFSPQTNVTPSVRVDYTQMRTPGYTETGAGPLNLIVEGSTYKEFLVTADAKASHGIGEHLKLVGNLSAGYDFLNKRAKTASAFTGGGPVFVTEGMEVSPWIYRAGIGLIYDDKRGMEYTARYDAETRSSGYLNQTISAKLRWAF
jgi:outer membrane autotransporter protein